MSSAYVAIDLGAESGRVMLGTLARGKVLLEEIHRFSNGPVHVAGSLRWDVLRLYDEILAGLKKVAARGSKIQSISTDSWGVDYVWLKKGEPFLSAPFNYRDSRTGTIYKQILGSPMARTIFSETGIQFMDFNTLFQLQDDLRQRPWIFETTDGFLNIADYFNYLLSGVARGEQSICSTTQVYGPAKHKWSSRLLRHYKLPARIFPKIVPSGTVLGPLAGELAAQKSFAETRVVASCSHDTSAAVAAVPAAGDDWAYLSCGTWSLLGIEAAKPIINEKSQRANFTNEVGYGGSIRFLKNISGLYMLQECRRSWEARGQSYNYDQLTALAGKAKPLKALLDIRDERFGKPGEMPEKIRAYCLETGQTPPADVGATVRCILESLALLYRTTLEQLEDITGKSIRKLHIVGGGSRNRLLNQLSADATGRTVVAGPVEATAVGNVLIQAAATGLLKGLADIRATVKKSFAVETYKPKDAKLWEEVAKKFRAISESR